ncbi:MAG: integrase core domain-containing protein [Acidimicrobiales bacterium]
MGTIRRECLDRLIILGRRHLELVLAEYVKQYNQHRPHRSLFQRAPCNGDASVASIADADRVYLRRADILGGIIHEYRLVA